MGSKLHRDFTLRYTSTPVVLDAQMSLTLSHISRSVPGCTTFLFLFGDMLQSRLIVIIFCTISFHVISYEVFNTGLWYWVSFDAFVYAHHKHRQVVRLLEILVIA